MAAKVPGARAGGRGGRRIRTGGLSPAPLPPMSRELAPERRHHPDQGTEGRQPGLARGLTRAKEREHLLTSAENRWRAVFDSAPVAMVELAFDGTVIGGNPALALLVGRPLDELVGRSWSSWVHAEDRSPFGERVASRASGDTGPGRGLEVRIVRPDGSERRTSARGSLVYLPDAGTQHVLVHLSDVTAEHARRQASEEAQARFTALVAHGTDVIATLDRAQALTYASPAYRAVYGVAPEEHLGRPLPDTFHPEDRDKVRDILRAMVAELGAVKTFMARAVRPDGTVRWMEVTVSNRLDDPAIQGLVCNGRDVTDRVRDAERLAQQALHDTLTGLANRVLFLDRLEGAVRRQGDRGYAVFFVDLDRFKAVNDTLGHGVGDELLVAVARRLEGVVRPGDTVARLGGDEFVLLAMHVRGEQAAVGIAERIRTAVGQPVMLRGHEVAVSCSIGVAMGAPQSPELLVERADIALYQAKERGRDRYAVFNPTMAVPARRWEPN